MRVLRGDFLPFRKSKGSLHSILKDNPFLKPFIGLPSKENGLDIEGFTTSDGKSLFLGQRGPRVDRYAVVVELKVPATSSQPSRRWPPTSSNSMDWRCAISPISTTKKFWCSPVRLATPQVRSLYRWRPRNSACAQKPTKLDWSIDPKQEKPEGICRLDRNGKSGVIVLYDSPDPCKRINGSTYKADWFPLT